MHLVDDEHLVASKLRRDARLLHQRLNVLDAIVGGGIQFEDVERTLLVERLATLALVAGLAVGCGILAVDGLGEDACAGGLAHATWAAEEVGVSQFAALDGILQRRGECFLTHDSVEGKGPVLSC